MASSKRKAGAEATTETGLLSGIGTNSVDTVNNVAAGNESSSQPSSNSKRGKRTHASSEVKENNPIHSTKVNSNEDGKGGKSSCSTPSRLQLLQNHNILHNVMTYLDEISLFQLENTYFEFIDISSIARQWSYLSSCDENKSIHHHKRWRSITEMDIESVGKEMELLDSKARGENTSVDLPDSLSREDLLARRIGRNFAEEAIFVQEREKEASRIYDFDRTPYHANDIPLSSRAIKETTGNHHWREWYDYRTNSVNSKHAFVRLSLLDGSGRFWQGFRELKTNYNTTFFRAVFNMSDLINHMDWTELHSALFPLMMNSWCGRMAHLMSMTQITVSMNGKLLIATGGYYTMTGGLNENEKFVFHPRHYRLPLAKTTKNDLQWMPYQATLKVDTAANELALELECDHADLPFMKAADIGKAGACAHW